MLAVKEVETNQTKTTDTDYLLIKGQRSAGSWDITGTENLPPIYRYMLVLQFSSRISPHPHPFCLLVGHTTTRATYGLWWYVCVECLPPADTRRGMWCLRHAGAAGALAWRRGPCGPVCAFTRACADGAAESLHTYVHTSVYVWHRLHRRRRARTKDHYYASCPPRAELRGELA